MKIIKKLALCALFSNVAYSADLPDLPEDHPIKTVVQMARCAFVQHPSMDNWEFDSLRWGLTPLLESIKHSVTNDLRICADLLFLREDFLNTFLITPQFNACLKRATFEGYSTCYLNFGPTLDSVSAEMDTYIHQSFEKHFNLQMEDKKFASAYKLALVYRDANTAHVENTAKANRWIAEVKAKATAEIEQIGNVVYALFLERALQTTEHMRATRIIDSFKSVDAVFHGHLNACFYAIVNKKTPIVPFAAEQLILARKLEYMVFRINDEDDA